MQYLKIYRAAHNMNQTKLAELLGTEKTVISKWETGLSLPKTKNLPEIAQKLGCTIEQLLSDITLENGALVIKRGE